MKITEIKMTKKGRYALFCGEEFLFSVDENTYADFGIHKGMDLDDQDLAELRKNSEYRNTAGNSHRWLTCHFCRRYRRSRFLRTLFTL